MKKNNSCAGNVLFLILIAVALFAALSYAITSSTRTGGGDASAESLKLQIADLQNYQTTLRSALQRITLSGGYQLWQIDYSDAASSNSAPNATCSKNDCRLFTTKGGTIVGRKSPSGNIWYFYNLSVQNIGREVRDFVAWSPIDRKLCMAVNVANNVANDYFDGGPNYDSWNYIYDGVPAEYTGTLTSDLDLSGPAKLGEDNVPSIAGKSMFCTMTGYSSFWVFLVLQER